MPETVASNEPFPVDIALDDTHVYWPQDATSTSDIMRTPKEPGVATPVSSGHPFPHSIAVDADGVYFTTWVNNGTVTAAALDGTSTTPLATALKSPLGLALAGGRLFATIQTGGTLVSVSTAGGDAQTLLTGLRKPSAVAADAAGTVFWCNDGDGTVEALLDGATTATRLGSYAGLRDIAVDQNYVFVLTANDVVRIPKP